MLGENIKKYREAKGFSQEQLAEQLHVVRQTVSKWEKNLSAPDAGLLVQLAGVLEVSVSELLGQESLAQESPTQENTAQGAPAQPGQSAGGRLRRALRAVYWTLAAVCGAVLVYRLAVSLALRRFVDTLDGSVGIIGGADGPTAILVTATRILPGWVEPALAALGLAVAIYGLWRTRKK